MGGLERRAAYLKAVRGGADASLLVDTGASLLGAQDGDDAQHDELIVRALTAMGYDALNAGAGELQAGPLARSRYGDAGAPVLLSANAQLAGDAPAGTLKPYVIRQVGELRLGLIGVSGETAAREPGVKITPPVEALRSLVPEVRRQADLVVLLIDAEPEEAQSLAAVGLPVPVILGARGVGSTPPSTVGPVLVTAAGGYGRYVSRLTLEVGPGGQILTYDWEDKALDDDVRADQDMLALRREYPY